MRNFRWRFLFCSVLVPFLLLGASPCVPLQETIQPQKLLALLDELIPVVARLRGLEPKGPIQKGIKSREEISAFVKEEASTQAEKNELRSEGLLLKKLGAIPADMDYAAFTLKLLTEQIGGYYDPEKRAFFIAGWLSADEQRPVMVHELTHALQDQHFDLKGMMKRDRQAHNDDLTMAHQAIAEGDATGVMLDYILQFTGMTFLDLPNLDQAMRGQLSLTGDEFAVLQSAPQYIKETLVFPYSYGSTFIQSARAHHQPWSVIDKIYSDMPASTEQIIHPEKYLDRRDAPKPVVCPDPTPRLGSHWKVIYRNVMGEFALYELLKLHLSEEAAKSAASGWGGDQVILAEENGHKGCAVFLESVWDDEESARRFYEAAADWLLKGYPGARRVGETEDGFGLVSDQEFRSILRDGLHVRLIVGLPESAAEKFSAR